MITEITTPLGRTVTVHKEGQTAELIYRDVVLSRHTIEEFDRHRPEIMRVADMMIDSWQERQTAQRVQ